MKRKDWALLACVAVAVLVLVGGGSAQAQVRGAVLLLFVGGVLLLVWLALSG